jgi:hypothetical protein
MIQLNNNATITFAAFLLLLASPESASAQRVNRIVEAAAPAKVTLDGIVSDGVGRPLAAAEVIVDDEHRAISNARGEFRIPDLGAGAIEFLARRIGYQPTKTIIQVEPGLTVHLAIKLVPVAVDIGTIVIEGKSVNKSLWQTGFYQRQVTGAGQYFDADYMRTHRAGLGALMENIASVRVERGGTGGRGPAIPTGRLPNGGACPLSVFVDGNFIPWATTTGIDDVVNRDDVLAVEVYPRASEMPPKIVGRGGAQGVGAIGTVTLKGASLQYGSGFAECGAILIWTRPLDEKR